MNNQEEQQPPLQHSVDLTKTIEVLNFSGDKIFHQGYIMRKASKFESGTPEDLMIPIPVFYDPKTGEIEQETLPPQLRETSLNINPEVTSDNPTWGVSENIDNNSNEFSWDQENGNNNENEISWDQENGNNNENENPDYSPWQ